MKKYAALVVVLFIAGGCATSGGDLDALYAVIPSDRPIVVGFDFDDTLVFSSPAFTETERLGFDRNDDAYWAKVNELCEGFCVIKPKTLEILRMHQRRGDEIFVVTARHAHGGDVLRVWAEQELGIAPDHFYFQRGGKAGRIKELGITIFYGDSDSDITAARDAGATPVRVQRSPDSSYKRRYNPGSFGELVIEGSD